MNTLKVNRKYKVGDRVMCKSYGDMNNHDIESTTWKNAPYKKGVIIHLEETVHSGGEILLSYRVDFADEYNVWWQRECDIQGIVV